MKDMPVILVPIALGLVFIVGLVFSPSIADSVASAIERSDELCVLETTTVAGVFPMLWYTGLLGLLLGAIAISILLLRQHLSATSLNGMVAILLLVTMGTLLFLANATPVQADSTVCLKIDGSNAMTADLNLNGNDLTNGGDIIGNTGRGATFTICSSTTVQVSTCDYTTDGTDDDVQVVAALAALPVGVGGTIQFTEGILYFGSMVDIYDTLNTAGWGTIKGKVLFQCMGREATQFRPAAAMASLFKAVTPNNTKTVRNIQFEGCGFYDATPYVTTALVDIEGSVNGYSGWNSFNNTWFYLKAPAAGSISAIQMGAAMVSSITNTYIGLVDGAGGDVYGVQQYGGSFTTLDMDNVDIEGDGSGNTYGILLAGWKHSLRKVTVEGMDTAIHLTSANGGASNSADITGAYLEGNTTDLILEGVNGGIQHYGTTIRDSYFGSDLTCISLAYADDIWIVNNVFDGACATAKVSIGAGVDRPHFLGNRGYVTEYSGTATIANGSTSIAVNHGLADTPSRVFCTPIENPTNAVTYWWVDTLGATQFTVHSNADPGASNLDFSCRAKVGEE